MKKKSLKTREELKDVLAVARGDKLPDLLIKNVKLLDLVCGEIVDTSIAISGNYIAGVGPEYSDLEATHIIDAEGKFAVPGFIDSHLHIESSLMHPFEFERMTLPRGTTSVVCDPHEVTNVLGEEGIDWFLRCSELTSQNLFVQMSSCVPALEGHETNVGKLTIEQMKKFMSHPNLLGLAEMMNFPGVIAGDDSVLDKLDLFSELHIDGHCPLLRGKGLNAYIAAGIMNCHETVLLEEGKEKLQKGMSLLIREGTVAKNLKALTPLVNEFSSMQCQLCTDDRNPYEIDKEGHIDFMIKYLINEGKVPAHVAYRVATFSAAKHFGMDHLGLIAPGKQADIVLLNDLEQVDIDEVLVKGKLVSELSLSSSVSKKMQKVDPPIGNSIQRFVMKADEFNFDLTKGIYNVIGIIPEEIITKKEKIEFDGEKFASDDILKIVVVERYGNNLKPSIGFVKGMGLKNGAIASSVAHDCHNIIAVGTNDREIAASVNSLIKSGGGFSVCENEKVKAMLPLPIAGLMSFDSYEEIIESIVQLKKECKKIGITLDEPFLQMAFLALPVIPSLKLTDKGLFDVDSFSFMDLMSEK